MREGSRMAEVVSLREAVAELVHDGDTVALEGFTHLIPVAAGQEVIRQGRRGPTRVRRRPALGSNQWMGRVAPANWSSPGAATRASAPCTASDAVQNGWPVPLEIEEHSHAGMANRYVAAASGLPFAVLRGYVGTDLVAHTPTIRPITCPFTGEVLTAVQALDLDVGIVHAQRADREGNVQLWGITGVQKEAVLGARRSLATVEEVVDQLQPKPGAMVLPSWTVSCVAEVPGGAHPSYAQGYYERDNDYYRAWDPISRDRDAFTEWLSTQVLASKATTRAGSRRPRR